MSRSNSFSEAKGSLKDWSVPLENWCKLNASMFAGTQGQMVPYACRERTNAGVLASAANHSGWVALEEYRTRKKNSDDRRHHGHGRADLVMIPPKATHRTLFDVETKFCRVSLLRPHDLRLLKITEKAAADSERSKCFADNAYKEVKVALTFIVPYVTETEPLLDDCREPMMALVEKCKKLGPWDAFAWSMPGVVRLTGTSVPRFSPGVILLAEETNSYVLRQSA